MSYIVVAVAGYFWTAAVVSLMAWLMDEKGWFGLTEILLIGLFWPLSLVMEIFQHIRWH